MLLQSVDTSEYISNKIDLGRQGEHDVRQIVFDLSPLIKTYGDGSAVLVFKRSDANAPYVVPAVRDGNKLIWTVSATDTSVKGCGRAEIRWNTEGGLAKTLIYITVTAASLPTNTIQPAGFKSWFDKMVEYIDSKTIESVELNDDTSVTFNFSNETSVTTPPLKGEKGETGPQGTKGDKGDRGDRGPTGATGETGPRGLKGDKGDTGATGPVGSQGPKGDTGPQGATGPRGLKGDKGDRGATGATGPKGDKGDTGEQGPKGDTGDTGPTGPQGPKGDKGDKGDTGETGATGPQGPKGDTGETGPQGLKGDTGETGAAGPTGPQGPQGEKGDTGDSGALSVVTVSGTTPSITAADNTRYICGEITSLSFTPCASGICDVRFTSGTAVTVLTLPSTVKMPDWFDPMSLEANVTYEINIVDGVYGAVMSWA